ncbi:MAG: quinone-dependent dihydroorotate dehydrogenase [Bacteriovoracaceae bacterium]|nr:quinone-dependent dihydroorotate dehydrogenase [Bacteriovoracaceae bacterium]
MFKKKLFPLIQKAAFKLNPELIHNQSFALFHKYPDFFANTFAGVNRAYGDHNRYRITSLDGLSWSFPVGVAAGLDKEAIALEFLSKIGFGAIEVGTVTPLPQPGNPKPRIFRYVEEKSIRNQMGFPNEGMEVIADRVEQFRQNCIGVNLGKNKLTPDDQSFRDYLLLYKKFAPICDYLVINVSSPNTPGLRKLQSSEALKEILGALWEQRHIHKTKLFVKISPDLDKEQIADVVEVAKTFELSGIVATNTTIMEQKGPGGVSGALLYNKAFEVRKYLLDLTRETKNLEIIGVGGFFNFDQIHEFWKQGGKFVQIYTSFIYQGPKILSDIQVGIDDLLKKQGASNLQELLSQF